MRPVHLPRNAFVAIALAALSCDSGAENDEPTATGSETAASELATSCQCSLPTSGLYATFKVGHESYSQQITNPLAIGDAIALWQGRSSKRIPVGSLTCECSGWNCPWKWHVDPATIHFERVVLETCNTLPSQASRLCTTSLRTYCPLNAQLTDLLDCRLNRTCPRVPRIIGPGQPGPGVQL